MTVLCGIFVTASHAQFTDLTNLGGSGNTGRPSGSGGYIDDQDSTGSGGTYDGNSIYDTRDGDGISSRNSQNPNGKPGNGNLDGNDTPAGQPPSRSRTPTNSDGLYDSPELRDGYGRRIPYMPGEFELYVQKQLRQYNRPPVRRFGANLMTDPTVASVVQDPLPAAPSDYIVRPGDRMHLTVWGSVDADLSLQVDREGNVSIPRVGAVHVGGLRNSDLNALLSKRFARTFRDFQLAASVGQVRAIRIFVGGYAQRPGSLVVNGMATVLHAVMRAGGPTAAGSFRDIRLRRGGRDVASFDLYDLLVYGRRDADLVLQPDDVIFIGPVGPQVALLGSVNQQAIYELKAGETLADTIRLAGGFNAVADRTRVVVERLADRATGHVQQWALAVQANDPLQTGDVVRAFSAVVATLPKERQNKRVRVEGEVVRPGDYVLPPGSRVDDAIAAAGGLTPAAYPFGTEFTRETVRETQQINYDRALRDLETDMIRSQANQRATSAEEINSQAQAANANAKLLARLRSVRPTGRVVMQIAPDATSLPDLPLEDGDTLSVPTRGSSIGVFGSVFTTGSFVFEPQRNAGQYLDLAGGPTRGADKGSIFMLRANGSVVSARQNGGFWSSGEGKFRETMVLPGDTIFVPEQLSKATFIQDAKDWTQILYQFGLGLAGLKALGL